jgi:two-component system, OmpR family, sensor histidine kinase BaeS
MLNQLAVAVANLESWLDGKLEPTPLRIKSVLQALAGLDALIDDLYGAASASGETPVADMRAHARVIDVCSTISNEVMGLEAAAAEKGVRLELAQCRVVHSECLSFFGDPVRIGQIVKNVALNAIRYTPAGGRVFVDCHRGPGRLELLITDEGPGLSAEDARRIYEPGYRGSAAGIASVAGSGLGLSVVKQLVEEQGGRVEVVRRERGAAFLVQLPGQALADCGACTAGAVCAQNQASTSN